MNATYDPLNPGYKICDFFGTHGFIRSLFENIELDIQICQSLDIDPMQEVNIYSHNEKYGYDFFKDGVTSEKEIIPNKSYFLLNLENIILDSKFSTYSRTAFFSVAYPLYKGILLSSIIPCERDKQNTKIP
jgi:hypothetical protein